MVIPNRQEGEEQGLVQNTTNLRQGLSRRQLLKWSVPVVAMVVTPRSVRIRRGES